VTSPLDAFPALEWGVEVVVGQTPERLHGVTRDEGFMQMAPGQFLALIDGVGRMHVTADRVTIQPDPGHTLDELDYVLYGWAPRWIRILRGEYSLHASAVVIDGGALAVMGFSGAGKSTTVTALSRLGHELIVDDVVPVDFVDEVPFVHGWVRPVHLTDEAAAHFDVPDTDRVGALATSKVVASLPSAGGLHRLLLAVELMVDDDAATVTTRRLAGAERLQAILNNANGAGVSAADGRATSFFAWATRVASAIEVYRVSRPPTGWFLDTVTGQIASIVQESQGAAR
jgi:hypothetical protein